MKKTLISLLFALTCMVVLCCSALAADAYDIDVVAPAQGGSITVSADAVNAGGSFTVTAEPESGLWVFDCIVINGLRWYGPSELTVGPVQSDVTVSAVFRPAGQFTDEPEVKPVPVKQTIQGFSSYHDVYSWDPNYRAILFVSDRGIMRGTGSGCFSPEIPMTRAMMATILWRMEGTPYAVPDSDFADVRTGEWYTMAVNWAYESGIVQGYGDGTFGTDDPLTHSQLLAMLYRWHFGTQADETAAWNWAQAHHLYEDLQVAPDDVASRGDVANMLMVFLTRVW